MDSDEKITALTERVEEMQARLDAYSAGLVEAMEAAGWPVPAALTAKPPRHLEAVDADR